MTYRQIHARAEAVLLAMVAEGRAEFVGQGRHGPVFRVPKAEALNRMEAAGLMGDRVPWPHTIRAFLALVEVAP